MSEEKHFTFDLRFREKETERAYSFSKIARQQILMKVATLLALAFVTVNWTLNPFEQKTTWLFYLRKSSSVVVLSLICLISRRASVYLEHALFFLFVVIFGFFSSREESFSRQSDPSMAFLNGVFVELLFLMIILAKMCWLKNLALFLAGNSLWAFRYLDFEVNYRTNFLPLVNFLLNFALLAAVSYFLERSDRRSFYEISSKEFSLTCFKDLIKTFFPSPIIISQGETLLFNNKEALSLFKCSEKSELLRCFENLVLCADESITEDQDFVTELVEDELEVIALRKAFSGYGNELSARERNPKTAGSLSLLDVMKRSVKLLKNKRTFLRSFKGIYDCHATNSTYFFDINIKNIVWKKKLAVMITLYENETIRKVKQLKEQSKYKDSLLATVSHDLRTPLNGIIGMLSLSVNLVAEKELKKNDAPHLFFSCCVSLEVALRSSQYLLFMINDFLDYHQISNGKLRMNFEVFSLWKLIEEASKLIKFQAKLKGLKFVMENKLLAGNELGIVKSDPNRIKQVVLNLLGNALKFTESGSISICLEERLEEKHERRAEMYVEGRHERDPNESERSPSFFLITVRDTGIGIKPEDREKLFKFFGKLENKASLERNKSGIGLGLAISQNIIKILNNNKAGFEIKLTSEVGKGSSFFFPVISRIEEEQYDDAESSAILAKKITDTYTSKTAHSKISLDLPAKEDHAPNGNHANNNRKANILVVDDDLINIMVASSFIKLIANCGFDTACNGAQAIEKIKAKAEEKIYYDIILMDCRMPIMSGFEATVLIKGLVEAKQIPNMKIIACTANASRADIEECFSAGMDDYLTKPFSKIEFVAKISQLIEKVLN